MYDDFENEFMSDEDIEATLDSIAECFGEQIIEDELRTAMVNPQKLQAIAHTYKMLKALTKGTNAKVVCELHKPFKSLGCVSVIGKDLIFSEPEYLTLAAKLASNFNVYPKVDGSIQMDFGFHGLTTPIE